MRTAARALTVATLLGSLCPAFVAGATAAGAGGNKPAVLQSNWYWYHTADAASGTGLEAAPEPSGVPDGDLSVAYTGGTDSDPDQPSKETYLAFDLGGLDPGTSITSFSFTLTVDGTPVTPATPALVACLPARQWNNGAASPWVAKPASEDCGLAIAAVGKYNANANTYTFTAPAMAQRWIEDVNVGVAIRHQPAKDGEHVAPFQLNFLGAKTVKASLSYLPAYTSPSTPGPAAAPAPAPATGTGSSGGAPISGSGTALTPTSGGAAPPPATAPKTDPTPQLAPQASAFGGPSGPSSSLPSSAFWLAAIGLGALLAAVSLVVGDPTTTPAAAGASASPSRLDRVLRARRTASSPAASTSSGIPRTALEN